VAWAGEGGARFAQGRGVAVFMGGRKGKKMGGGTDLLTLFFPEENSN
jgi:hypothetical protein